MATVRNRAADFLSADPGTALDIANALTRAVSRRGAGAEARAIAYRCHAEACLFAGRLSESRRGYERAAQDAGAAGAASLEGQILVGWIGLLGMIGEDTPPRLIRRAERLLASSGDRVYLGKLFMNLGNVAYSDERYASADDQYERAAKIFERAGLRDATWAGLLINRGIANTHLSRIAEARVLLDRAASACRALRLPRLLAQAELNLAHVEQLRGDYRSTLRLLRDAGDAFRRVSAIDMVAATDRARAEVFLELSMAAEAEELAASARAAFTSEGMALDAMLAAIDEAEAKLQQRHPAGALRLLEDALAYFEAHRLGPRRATTRLRLARARLSAGDAGGALRDARAALSALRRRNMTRGIVEGTRIVAVAYLTQGRLALAAQAAERARRSAVRLPVGVRGELDGLSARIAIAQGRRRSARTFLRRAVTRLEAHRLGLPGAAYRAHAFEGEVRVHLDLLDVVAAASRPNLDELLSTLERSRAEAFRDRASARGRGAARTVDDARARVRALTRRVETLEVTAKAGRSEWRDARRILARSERELLAVLRRTEVDSDRRRRVPERPIDALAKRVAGDEARVHYFVTSRRVGALVVTREKAGLVPLDVSPGALADLAERARFQINTVAAVSRMGLDADSLVNAVHVPLRGLHAALLAPLESTLSGVRHLRLVPHGVLHGVPFECLLDDAGRYACDRYTMTRAATAFGSVTRRRGRRVTRPLVAGTVQGGPPLVARELRAVAETLDDADVVENPSADVLLDAMRTRSRIHLCAHGTFRSDNPMFSRIALRDDSLFVADLVAGSIRADLVVLSACQSARAHASKGDDLVGITHAFLSAGARRLVGSLWVAHDEATLVFMQAFHVALAEEGDILAALAAARRAVRSRWSHPFFWSAFGLYEA